MGPWWTQTSRRHLGSDLVKQFLIRLIEEHACFCLFVLQVATWPVIAMLAWEVWCK
jgi:hypothetical protein